MEIFAFISMSVLVSIVMIPISASAQELDCVELPLGEMGDCLLNETLEQYNESQEQAIEAANANATAVTSNETINAGIYVNNTRFE